MGIPIKKYIDISTTALNTQGANRDYSGLLFSNVEMKSGATPALKNDYDDGEVITVSMTQVGACFDATSSVYKFAEKYFGFVSNLGRSPDRLNIVKVSGSVGADTFTNVVDKFSNFGAFAFASGSYVEGVASANDGLGRQYAYVCEHGSDATYGEFKGTHVIKCNETSDIAYIVAWVAVRDYTIPNGAETIDYTVIPGAIPTVNDGNTKDALDAMHVNYIGHVQQRGINRSFYQRGVNLDGIDLGVYMDSAWIQSEIEAGWINLALGATKIPANEFGLMRVRAMVVGVAERGLENGCILPGKPLTNEQQMDINAFANEAGAATSVMTNGYFISTRLFQDTDDLGKWTVQYTLIYSKGDHIEKIRGQHILV